jgi:chromosome segregation ATPase
MAAQQQQEDAVKQERDRVSQLLSAEIKKVALLTKVRACSLPPCSSASSHACRCPPLVCLQDNERKDKLVVIAMAARHEMAQHATCQERLVASVRAQFDALETRAQAAEDEVAVLKLQLDAAYARVATTGSEIQDAGEREQRLRDELRVAVQAAQARELEMQNAFDRQQTALQQRLDKTKRELMETMSTNLNLDSRLRKAQEKLARAAAAAAAASSNSSGDGIDGF